MSRRGRKRQSSIDAAALEELARGIIDREDDETQAAINRQLFSIIDDDHSSHYFSHIYHPHIRAVVSAPFGSASLGSAPLGSAPPLPQSAAPKPKPKPKPKNEIKDDDTKKPPEIQDCVVCMDKKSTHILLPCLHLCLCGTCAKTIGNQVKNCPKCRQTIESVKYVYF